MRTIFNLMAGALYLAAAVFAGFGVWIASTDSPAIGLLVLFSAACSGFLGEGCRGAARREPVTVKLPR